MVPLPALPMCLQDLTREIKEKECELEGLRAADRTAYKTYVRARTKLMSKAHRDVQDEGVAKWYNVWVRSANELQALATRLEREGAELVGLKQRRADRVARDRVGFERELLRR